MTRFTTKSAKIAMLVAGGVMALAASEANAGHRSSVRYSNYRPAPTYARSYTTYYAPRVREVVYARPVTTYVYSRPACEVVRPVCVTPSYSYSRPVVYGSSYSSCYTRPVYYSRPAYSVGLSYRSHHGGGSFYYRR
jgi:hypothetical protein